MGGDKLCHSCSVSGGDEGRETYRLLWSSEEFRSKGGHTSIAGRFGEHGGSHRPDCADMI